MAINKVISSKRQTHASMRNVIEYTLKSEKVKEGYCATYGPNMPITNINWHNVNRAFRDEKGLWGKDNGRMYKHSIISFHKDEDITPAQALEFAKEIVGTDPFYKDFQNVIGIHQDRDHIHAHIVTNSVSFIDGHKHQSSQKEIQRLMDRTDELCREKGLSIAEKGKHFDGTKIEEYELTTSKMKTYKQLLNTEKESFMLNCLDSIQECASISASKEEFISHMADHGWQINWKDTRKHITFVNEDGKKLRDSNISKTLNVDISKEWLYGEFEKQNELRQERFQREQAELDKYYREVESAELGITGETIGDYQETKTIISGERPDDTDAFIRELNTKERTATEKRESAELGRSNREDERERLAIEQARAERERAEAERQRIAEERAETLRKRKLAKERARHDHGISL